MRKTTSVTLCAIIAIVMIALFLYRKSPVVVETNAKTPAEEIASSSEDPRESVSRADQQDASATESPSIKLYKALSVRYTRIMRMDLVEGNQSRFHTQEVMGLTPARIFATLEPETTISESERVLNDEGAGHLDQLFAVQMLRFLLVGGNSGGEGILVKIANGTHRMGGAAVQALVDGDRWGKHTGLYMQYALRDSIPAVEALSYWPNDAAYSLLIQVRDAGKDKPAPVGMVAYMAGKAAERGALLSGADWQSKAADLLKHKGRPEVQWALKVLETREHIADYLPVLLTRLEVGEVRAFVDEDATPSDPRFGTRTGDALYDDVLLAYHRAGGKLSPNHELRLRTFGYLGNARERLVKIMNQ